MGDWSLSKFGEALEASAKERDAAALKRVNEYRERWDSEMLRFSQMKNESLLAMYREYPYSGPFQIPEEKQLLADVEEALRVEILKRMEGRVNG